MGKARDRQRDRASRAVTTLIGADESGRKPRNHLRKALFTAVGMRKSDRGTFMPNVTTLRAVLALLGLAGVLEDWDAPSPPPHLAPWRPAGPFEAYQQYFLAVRDWLQGVEHLLRPISDAHVAQVFQYLEANGLVGTAAAAAAAAASGGAAPTAATAAPPAQGTHRTPTPSPTPKSPTPTAPNTPVARTLGQGVEPARAPMSEAGVSPPCLSRLSLGAAPSLPALSVNRPVVPAVPDEFDAFLPQEWAEVCVWEWTPIACDTPAVEGYFGGPPLVQPQEDAPPAAPHDLFQVKTEGPEGAGGSTTPAATTAATTATTGGGGGGGDGGGSSGNPASLGSSQSTLSQLPLVLALHHEPMRDVGPSGCHDPKRAGTAGRRRRPPATEPDQCHTPGGGPDPGQESPWSTGPRKRARSGTFASG